MKLLSSPASPFGAKVKIWAHLLGIHDQIQLEMVDTIGMAGAGTHPNPLGKIPCLLIEDKAVFDSAVICEYLAEHAGNLNGLPQSLDEKVQLSLINGLTEAALLVVYEGRMHASEHQSEKWLTMQHRKIEQALAALEVSDTPASDSMAGAALAAALSYLDLRLSDQWRAEHANLAAWLADFSNRYPWFERIKPSA